jgi:diguanylate cyclase
METIVIAVLYGLTTATIGAAAAVWACSRSVRRGVAAGANTEAQHAAEILVRLQELATRVAFDVDEHSSQVEEINDKLTSAGDHQPAMIVDVVAKLVETNQRMHERLALNENKLREQAEELQTHAVEARTDALTLLANRRAFDDELARRFAELRRQGRVFSLILADVDYFKRFNDNHGHQVGDEMLRNVAKLLRRKMREMDLVARYGGEEFAIVLPGTSLNDASRAALRACEGLGRSHFRHDGKELKVTASFGVAQAQGNEDGAELVTRADTALYAAKNAGRDCVYLHNGQAIDRAVPDEQPKLPTAKCRPEDAPTPNQQEPPEAAGKAAEGLVSEAKPDANPVDSGPLSGFASRTSFCQQVRNRTAEWKRGGPTFSVALIEVSEYCGDNRDRLRAGETSALVAARFLAATVREMDVAARYAPGCFALLLPTAGLVDAARVAERLREGISQCSCPAEAGWTRFLANVGVVQVMEQDDSLSVLRRAEAALDAARRQGGHRACCHDGEQCVPIDSALEATGCPASSLVPATAS